MLERQRNHFVLKFKLQFKLMFKFFLITQIWCCSEEFLLVFIWITEVIFKAFNFPFCLFFFFFWTPVLSLVAWCELQSLKRAFPGAG